MLVTPVSWAIVAVKVWQLGVREAEVPPVVEAVHSNSHLQWRLLMLVNPINQTFNAAEAKAVTPDKAPATSKGIGASRTINKTRNSHNRWVSSIKLKEWVLEVFSQAIEAEAR